MAYKQHSTRERGQATATNPESIGGLLHLHHGGGVGDVGESGDAIGDGSTTFPPPIFVGLAFVLRFSCFSIASF
jgi:hypothetical protein